MELIEIVESINSPGEIQKDSEIPMDIKILAILSLKHHIAV